MATVFAEGRRAFSFGETVWESLYRHDQSAVHLRIAQHVQRTQAVDFVALGQSAVSVRIAFIEAKDYRQANQPPRLTELAAEVAEKVAGTLVGITAGARLDPPEPAMRMAGRCLREAGPLHVFLHIETHGQRSVEDTKAELGTLALLIEKKLAWLAGCRVIACSEAVPKIPDCRVTTT